MNPTKLPPPTARERKKMEEEKEKAIQQFMERIRSEAQSEENRFTLPHHRHPHSHSHPHPHLRPPRLLPPRRPPHFEFVMAEEKKKTRRVKPRRKLAGRLSGRTRGGVGAVAGAGAGAGTGVGASSGGNEKYKARVVDNGWGGMQENEDQDQDEDDDNDGSGGADIASDDEASDVIFFVLCQRQCHLNGHCPNSIPFVMLCRCRRLIVLSVRSSWSSASMLCCHAFPVSMSNVCHVISSRMRMWVEIMCVPCVEFRLIIRDQQCSNRRWLKIERESFVRVEINTDKEGEWK